ncbi:MAG: hypothetical protein IJ318_03900 [Clostridia bacterium]|nr:hypothetical protein [Clostridia bacterium]
MINKICFIAPSGYGKTTAINLLAKDYNIKNIKIAEPLYDLQSRFYDYINAKLIGEQDGELLQFFGAKIRKINSNFLLDKFIEQVKKLSKQFCIITNDDCRTPDYLTLKDIGFTFVGIRGFCRTRIDQTKADPNNSLEWQQIDFCDFYVNNFGTMDEYKEELNKLMIKLNG